MDVFSYKGFKLRGMLSADGMAGEVLVFIPGTMEAIHKTTSLDLAMRFVDGRQKAIEQEVNQTEEW